MRTVAVINQKGGVGKTTTAANLGAAIGQAGYDICLLDLDPQAHLTLHFGMRMTIWIEVDPRSVRTTS